MPNDGGEGLRCHDDVQAVLKVVFKKLDLKHSHERKAAEMVKRMLGIKRRRWTRHMNVKIMSSSNKFENKTFREETSKVLFQFKNIFILPCSLSFVCQSVIPS